MDDELRQRIRNRPRRWVVTGAGGFIGSHLLEALLGLDQRVIGLDNFSLGRRDNLADVRDAVSADQWRNFRMIEGDIRSLDTCRRACRSADVVLHQFLHVLGALHREVVAQARADQTAVLVVVVAVVRQVEHLRLHAQVVHLPPETPQLRLDFLARHLVHFDCLHGIRPPACG